MASISKEKNGRKTIQFVGPDERRRSLRLGKASMKVAEGIKVRVEQLLAAKLSGVPWEAELAKWVSQLDKAMRSKLERVGLLDPKEHLAIPKLQEFIDTYIASRTDVKDSTRAIYSQARKSLIRFFGSDKEITSINEADAEDWRRSLSSDEELAEGTIRKRSAMAKLFFRHAIKKRILRDNPFASLQSAAISNESRFYFVSRDDAPKVIDACPDIEWRLIFILSRYGGLRCPSEHLALKWEDINWEQERMTVTVPKLERLNGLGTRVIPLFPEIRVVLQEAFDLAEEGAIHVITRYRRANTNLRTQLLKIITRAGLEPWPKLFQNLRSTRQTELSEIFPEHVVTKWLGNSPQVAKKHYLQVTDEHYKKAVRNPVQQPAERRRKDSQERSRDDEKNRPKASWCNDLRRDARVCDKRVSGRTWIRTMDLVVISDAL